MDYECLLAITTPPGWRFVLFTLSFFCVSLLSLVRYPRMCFVVAFTCFTLMAALVGITTNKHQQQQPHLPSQAPLVVHGIFPVLLQLFLLQYSNKKLRGNLLVPINKQQQQQQQSASDVQRVNGVPAYVLCVWVCVSASQIDGFFIKSDERITIKHASVSHSGECFSYDRRRFYFELIKSYKRALNGRQLNANHLNSQLWFVCVCWFELRAVHWPFRGSKMFSLRR